VADGESNQGSEKVREERLALTLEAAEFVRRTVAAAPPMSDEMIADLRLIIWGPAGVIPAAGKAS